MDEHGRFQERLGRRLPWELPQLSGREGRRLAAVAMAACLLEGGLGACDGGPGAPASGRMRVAGRIELARLVGAFRPFEGRLVGVAWRRWPPDQLDPRRDARSASAPGEAARWRVAQRARLGLEAVADAHGSPDRLAARALVEIIEGKLAGAEDALRQAAARDAEPAAWLSDLAAVEMQRGLELHKPYLLVLALGAAERALRSDPALLPAAFNRALLLEKLFLEQKARTAWRDYLVREKEPGWRREAEGHLERLLSRPAARAATWQARREELMRAAAGGGRRQIGGIVHAFPQEARETVQNELLPGWARALRERNLLAAERDLGAARAIGEALAAENRDRLPSEAVAAIDAATSPTAPPREHAQGSRLELLTAGHFEHGEGLARYQDGDFGAAASWMERAYRDLKGAGSPFAEWLRFELARCAYQHDRYPEAKRLLEGLIDEREGAHHPALRGSALNLLGVVEVLRDSPIAAAARYREALAAFDTAGEPGSSAIVESGVAGDRRLLGESDGIWDSLLPALGQAVESGVPRTIYLTFEQAALAALRLGEPGPALAFQDEVVEAALRDGRAAVIVEGLRGRAWLRAGAGDRRGALEDLGQADRRSGGLRDEETRRIIAGDLLRVRGEVEGGLDPEAAVGLLGKAADLYRDTDFHYLTARVLLEKGLALHRLRREDEAERDLLAAVAERERQRRRISDPLQRISFFDDLQEIFEAAVRFEVEARNRPDLAFDLTERARARLLLDYLLADAEPARAGGRAPDPAAGGLGEPLDASQIRHRLAGRSAAVIEYFQLSDRLLAWVLLPEGAPDGLRSHTLTCTRAQLGRLEQRVAQTFGEEKSDAELSATLYDLLLRPLAADLPAGATLFIVPGSELAGIPFPALRDQRSGRTLIAEHALVVAPSASALVAGCGGDPSRPHPGGPGGADGRAGLGGLSGLGGLEKWRVLAIDDPEVDREAFPGLPDLHFAGRAAGWWLARHPGSAALAGAGATRAAFLAEAGGYEVLAFSGHALVDREAPLRSSLVFARVPGHPDESLLRAGDLLGHPLPRTRLVILAGCATAAGRLSRSEGTLSLTTPFLAAGVPAVVGSLWTIEDRESERLLAAFFRHLAGGDTAAEALRAAQIEAIREEATRAGAGAAAWAAFEMAGSAC